MSDLRDIVYKYLERHKEFYPPSEIEENLQLLDNQKEDLSDLEAFEKVLQLRFIDDNEIYYQIKNL